MSMAKPTIASDIGEARNILRNRETGFLAKTKEEFISAMGRLAEDAELCRRMGKEARRDVEQHYSLNVLSKKLADILRSI